MTTTVLNRLLLHLRRAECRQVSSLAADEASGDEELAEAGLWDPRRSRAISPFGLIPISKRMSSGSDHSARSDDPDHEAGRGPGHRRGLSDLDGLVPPPFTYHYQKHVPDPSESFLLY